MGEGRVDIHGFAGDGLLALGLQVLEGAHVVEAVGQLDEHDAHVGHHGQQHLAHVFGLAVFAVGELDLVDLGDALDDVRHLVAESGVDFLAGGGRVFDRIVEQAGGDGRGVELHLGQDFRHFEGVDDVGLAGGAHLAGMVLDAELPGFANEGNVFAGAVGLNLAQEAFETLVDDFLGNDRLGERRRNRGQIVAGRLLIVHRNRTLVQRHRITGFMSRRGMIDRRHALL